MRVRTKDWPLAVRECEEPPVSRIYITKRKLTPLPGFCSPPENHPAVVECRVAARVGPCAWVFSVLRTPSGTPRLFCASIVHGPAMRAGQRFLAPGPQYQDTRLLGIESCKGSEPATEPAAESPGYTAGASA